MFPSPQYHESTRKYIIAFGRLFTDISCGRFNSAGARIQTIQVPIAYGPKEKWMVRAKDDPDLSKPMDITVPRLAFEIVGMRYDGSRHLASTQKNKAFDSLDKNKFYTQFVGVPYNIDINLHALVKNVDDATQIMEQIVPYFSPQWTTSVNVVPGMVPPIDVPIVLNGVTMEDTYEGDFQTRRFIIYTFAFTLKGFFYGPKTTSGVIKRAQIDWYTIRANANTEPLYGITFPSISPEEMDDAKINERLVVRPGLLANGVGTTNSSASISYRTISANSDWKYASNTAFYPGGRRYDPVSGTDTV